MNGPYRLLITGFIKENLNTYTIESILVDIIVAKELLPLRTNTDLPLQVKAKASEEALHLTVETIRGVYLDLKLRHNGGMVGADGLEPPTFCV